MTSIPGVANLDPASARAPCARRRRTPLTTASSSTSTVAGVPPRTRNSCSARRSRSTARKRRLPDGSPPPDTSPHVSGDAVDIGPSDATAWLSEHGAGYGLCQIYGNEPWHYELRPEAVDHGCPSHVRRPHARSADAALTGAVGRSGPDPRCLRSRDSRRPAPAESVDAHRTYRCDLPRRRTQRDAQPLKACRPLSARSKSSCTKFGCWLQPLLSS